jgi:hypothetical protein
VRNTRLVAALAAIVMCAAPAIAQGAQPPEGPGNSEFGQAMAAQQQHDHPGGGYVFDPHGRCHSSWEDPGDPGTCVHADYHDPGVSTPVVDPPINVYSQNYLTDLSTGQAYCNGPNPGYRFRVLYVTTVARGSRYASLRPTLQDAAENADSMVFESAQQSGGKRHIRYTCVTPPAPLPVLESEEQIEIKEVVLPNAADNSFDATVRELRAAGYNNSNRKYIAFVDWKECCNADGTRRNTVAGRGEIKDDSSYGQANLNNLGNRIGVMYLPVCTDCYASVALHEMVHTMGGVQDDAPRHDGQNYWHPRDEYDRMAYGSNTYVGCSNTANEYRLDCNKNDYFNTSPATGTYLRQNWNVARNQFLVGGG